MLIAHDRLRTIVGTIVATAERVLSDVRDGFTTMALSRARPTVW